MHVLAWLNEGLAELLCYTFLKDAARMEAALREFQNASDRLTWREISRPLDDLADERRVEACVLATGAVAELAREVEIPRLFDRLLEVDRAVPLDVVCAVPSLEEAPVPSLLVGVDLRGLLPAEGNGTGVLRGRCRGEGRMSPCPRAFGRGA